LPSRAFSDDVQVHGSAHGAGAVRIVVDGNLGRAQRVQVDRQGRWHAVVPTGAMIDPRIAHRVVAWDERSGAVSATRTFQVSPAWRRLADVDDPRGDDTGPGGHYLYPLDPGWRVHHPADIERVQAWGAHGALRVALRMHDVVSQWNPPYGFDHVAFTLFVQLPGASGGSTVLPLQHAQLPGDMRWDYRLRANGWSIASFNAAGASDAKEGTAGGPSPDVSVDKAARTITFTIPATALGDRASLAGARLYVTTWDYDGGYRALSPQAQPAAFGGGDGARDPLVMDSTDVIVLR
jgi:carbohydrate-binding DOMON domain-containing protein